MIREAIKVIKEKRKAVMKGKKVGCVDGLRSK